MFACISLQAFVDFVDKVLESFRKLSSSCIQGIGLLASWNYRVHTTEFGSLGKMAALES